MNLSDSFRLDRVLKLPFRWNVVRVGVLVLGVLLSSGCINSLVMMGKTFLGDPMQKSVFEQSSGISLKHSEQKILVHCSSPTFATDSYSTLAGDVEEELIRKLKRHGINVAHPDAASRVLDEFGGKFDPQMLAKELDDIDFITHIQIDEFSFQEPSSPTLYRGKARGRVTAFKVRDDEDRSVIQIFEHQFNVSYPTTYPVPVDQVTESVFIDRVVNRMAESLGATFYDVSNSELFAN